MRQQSEVRRGFQLQPDLLRLTEDTADARMSILHIVNGVVARLLDGKVEIEIQLAVHRTR